MAALPCDLVGDIHLTGYCDECDAQRAARMTLAQVEQRYRSGHFSQDVYEAYMHVWATSAHRYANHGNWAEPPTNPRVVALADRIRELAAANN